MITSTCRVVLIKSILYFYTTRIYSLKFREYIPWIHLRLQSLYLIFIYFFKLVLSSSINLMCKKKLYGVQSNEMNAQKYNQNKKKIQNKPRIYL